MKDFMKPVAGNKMVELKAEINDLKALLAKTDDPDRIRHLKKVISEKQTYYNILVDKVRLAK
ncbi:MAG: hypothetical protein I3I94_03780 [Acidaminococcaceae bacterium]|jgi:hypothetical protein|nr:hypothetical protein [Acidaminococcaceae bacterium]HAY61622.1 hypothetical protein [Acidaminococcaceae bacterium]HCJ90821.1 hypothetical protein [Acidaminococcaceae bacterium]